MLYKTRRSQAAPVEVLVETITKPVEPAPVLAEVAPLSDEATPAAGVRLTYIQALKTRRLLLKVIEQRRGCLVIDPVDMYSDYCDWTKSIDEAPLNRKHFKNEVLKCPAVKYKQLWFDGVRKNAFTIERNYFEEASK